MVIVFAGRFVRSTKAVEYGVIFVIVVGVLGAVVVGHELARRAIVRDRSRRRRITGTVAAVVVAYLLACAPVFVLQACRGVPVERYYAVGELLDGFDAATKLQRGDVILAVDGQRVSPGASPSLAERVGAGGGAAVTLTVRRDGAAREIVVQPTREHDRWLLGIKIAHEVVRDTSVGPAATAALASPIGRAVAVVADLRSLIVEEETPDPGGPKRMIDEFSAANIAEPAWVRGLAGAALAAFYALLVLLAIDLARIVTTAFARPA